MSDIEAAAFIALVALMVVIALWRDNVAHESKRLGERAQALKIAPVNHSIYSADRTTHLKVVVIVALIAGILVAGFGISVHNSSDEGLTQTARVMKAGNMSLATAYLDSVNSEQRVAVEHGVGVAGHSGGTESSPSPPGRGFLGFGFCGITSCGPIGPRLNVHGFAGIERRRRYN
jgi:hypothetical protein